MENPHNGPSVLLVLKSNWFLFEIATGFPLIMVPVNKLFLTTVIYGSLCNSKSRKIKIMETQNLNLRYLWRSVNLKIREPKYRKPKIQAV